jgi:hypothetical protein
MTFKVTGMIKGQRLTMIYNLKTVGDSAIVNKERLGKRLKEMLIASANKKGCNIRHGQPVPCFSWSVL